MPPMQTYGENSAGAVKPVQEDTPVHSYIRELKDRANGLGDHLNFLRQQRDILDATINEVEHQLADLSGKMTPQVAHVPDGRIR
jgi:chromosome segregation ATPase